MATLKSIKNKYLDTADGTALGVTTNTDNVSLLAFKLATADSLSKFNLVDGFSDDYQDATGVDAGGSTDAVRDSTGKYYAATVDVQSYTAKGGGAGGNRSDTAALQDGQPGGSGGGGGSTSGDGHTTTGGTSNKNSYPGWTSQGGTGGTGQHVGGSHEGGGAGGSPNTVSPNGGNSSGGTGGDGANGYETGISGTSVTYAGGGRGTGNSYGSNGSGAGNAANKAGGGESNGGPAGQNGGSGVVWMAYTPSGQPATQTGITATGTFTIPTGVSAMDIVMFGGGGPGGFGASSGGGGGGALLRHTTLAVTAGHVWNVTIGAGGTAAASAAALGTNGGDTTFAMSTYASTMILESNTFTAASEPDTARIVLDEYTSTGTTTVNTDIKAYASRDGGTTYTQITALADQGTIGTTHRLLSGSVDISGQPSGTSVTYKVETLNQGVGKATRVYGTSMAWA